MKIPSFLSKSDHIEIIVIGAGGNGSHFVKTFADFDMLNKHVEYMDFKVSVFDDDFIESHNTSRQAFNPASVGFNKAVNICSKINSSYGLTYKAYPEKYDCDRPHRLHHYRIFVLAVDSPSFRHSFYKNNPDDIIIDMGNGNDFGQVWFYYSPEIRKKDPFKRYMKSLYDARRRKRKHTSCSHLDSIKSQGLYVNNSMANIAATWIYNLIMYNPLSLNYVTYYNSKLMKMNSIACDVDYHHKCESPLINVI